MSGDGGTGVRAGAGTRLALVGAAAVALLAVVGLASRGGLGGGGRGPAPPAALLDYGFSIFVVLYVLAIPFALWAFVVQRGAARARGGKSPGSRALANIVGFAVLAAAAVVLTTMRHARGEEGGLRLPKPAVPQAGARKQPQATAREPRFRWSVVAAAAALGAAGGAYLLVRRGRRGEARPAALPEALAAAFDDAIDDVRAETDPRRAVVKAYARMESILAAHGTARAPSEAPYEYLARAFEQTAASAASAERLTELYERARFSAHEIGPRLRRDAIAALTAVRDELRGEA